MADSRRLALERWSEEKRRQKEKDTIKVSRPARLMIAHRGARRAPEHTRVANERRQMPVIVARRVSQELNSLAPIKELEKGQELLFKTPAKVKSDTDAETDKTTSAASVDSMAISTVSTSKKRRRRRSYISPISDAPSLAGGAQRVRTPTQPLVANESGDDGGMDEDTEETTPDIVPGPGRVSVLMRQRKSDEVAEPVTPYKTEQEGEEGHVYSRETISFGSIGAALRISHAGKESENKSDAGPELPRSPTLRAEKNLQVSLAVRVSSTDYDDNANTHVEIPPPGRKLIFPDRVRLDPAKIQTRTSIDRKASRKSFSSRISLDDPKSVQSVSERLAEKSKWEIDDFIVTKNLGQGKFGNVYLAKEKCTNVLVALKVLFKSPLVHNGDASNLKREVEIQMRLCHPNVLRMHGYFYDDSCVYLVLEYAPYGELYKELAREKYFTNDVAAYYVAQVIEALNYCHSCNVIHRDIKPENLLLGYNKTIKLADFGWSVHAPRPYNLRKTFCGTPDYLSPEIVMGESYDYRTDCWSLGVLTYELLVGSTPFYCANQMEMYQRIQVVDYHFPPIPVICDSAKSFIAGLLKRKPNDRMRLEDAFKHPWIHSRHSK